MSAALGARRLRFVPAATRWVAVSGLLLAAGPAYGQSSPGAARTAAPPVTSSTVGQVLLPVPTLADHQAQLNAFRLRVDALKSKVSSIDARVAGLKQIVLAGKVLATRAQLVHRNEMGGNFRLEKATYRLDGLEIFVRSAEDGLADSKEVVLFDGPLTPGGHAIDVELVFAGSPVGVFTYLRGYKFNVRSRYQLDVVEGRNTRLKIVAYEDEDITVEAKNRFKVRYDVEVNDDAPRAVQQP